MHLEPGTRALVTGASRGIGRALAERLAPRGVTVGLAARSTRELEALADALPGSHVVLGGTDVGDPASIDAAVERFGHVDVLVAAAGVTDAVPFAEQSPGDVEALVRVNLLGVTATVAAALPALVAQRSGHVVVVSGSEGSAVTAATRAARQAFADALRGELAGSGVSVTTVVAGAVPAHRVADRIVRAIERDEPQVFVPRAARLRGAVTRG